MAPGSLEPPWRLLFLLHCPPRPDSAHGGGRVIAQLLTGLSERHHLALVYLRDLGEPPIDEGLRHRCQIAREVLRVDTPRSLPGRVRHRLRVTVAPLWGLPRWAAHLPAGRFAAVANSVIREWQPHIIQLEFSVMGRYLAHLDAPRVPRVLNLHMPGEDAVPSDLRTRGWWSRLHHRLDRRAWRRFERRTLPQVSAVVTFTERDRQAVAGRAAGVRVAHIPAGMTVPAAPLDPVGGVPPRLLLIGHYRHPPNADAAERLVHGILPRLRRRFPDLGLWLVGGGLPAALAGRSADGVIATGEVPDVTPYLAHAAVVVAPLRLGGGVRVKALEALAAGKALVATRLALEGIPVTPGGEVILAESDEDFVEAIEPLLADPERRRALGRRARAWCEVNLGWDRAIAAYEALYAGLIDSTRQAPI